MYISQSVMFDIHTGKHRCRPSPGFVMFVFHLDHIFTVSASPPLPLLSESQHTTHHLSVNTDIISFIHITYNSIIQKLLTGWARVRV